jgi:DNA-binding response OmpR family regulator
VREASNSVTEPGPEEAGDKGLILLVEDDQTISNLLAFNLRRAGYRVIQEFSGRAGLDTALSQPIDLVLMDVMLPGLDGISASRGLLRSKPHVQVIMLTAVVDRERLLEGFEAGAVDYVTKPFDLDVLMARIAASLRRLPVNPVVALVEKTAPAVLGETVVDSDARTLRRGSTEVSLTPNEYALLELLLSQPGHLFRREEITERVWHHHYLSSSRTLDVHMRRLRQKLHAVKADVTVHVVRGVGYRVAP